MEKEYIVITGASSGIGQATAKLMASNGKNLILIARRKEVLEGMKEEILKENPGLDIIVCPADLTNIDALPALYDSLRQYPKEAWVNNAGFGMLSLVADQEVEKVRQMIRLNVEALTILSMLFVKENKDVEGAQLLNVASANGYIIAPISTIYGATKFYVTSFTEGLALELKSTNAKLRAKVLAPGAVKTNFAAVATGDPNVKYDHGYFEHYNTKEEMASYLWQLYESDQVVGYVDYAKFTLSLEGPRFQNLYQ